MMKKKLKTCKRNLSIQKRITISCIIAGIIPLLIIGSVWIVNTLRASKESHVTLSESALHHIEIRLQSLVAMAESTALEIANDPIIHHALTHETLHDTISNVYDIDTYLHHKQTYNDHLSGIYILSHNLSAYGSHHEERTYDDFTQTWWYQRIKKTTEPTWFSTPTHALAIEANDNTAISLGVPIVHKENSELLGILYMDLDMKVMDDILQYPMDNMEQFILLDVHHNMMMGSNGIHDRDARTIKNALDLAKDYEPITLTINDQKKQLLRKPLPIHHWSIIGIVSPNPMDTNNTLAIIFLICLVVLIIVLTYYVSKRIARTITTPIHHMLHQMKAVESGHLDVHAKVYYNDEMGALTKGFNTMTKHLTKSMKTVVQEQQQLRKYEFKALQSQINPHFLYNTLDSVVWLARMQQYKDIIDVVTSMTRLFRISLSRGKHIITIEEEIDHVTSYLMIQKYRYRTHFDYDIRVSEDIYQYKTLKLLLQPLVENAIYHGIKLKRDGGHIAIEGYASQDQIIFKVSDTGLGMTKETLHAIHQSFETNTDSGVTMYGIKNVHDRIKLYFGDNYSLTYESELGKGTTAIVTLPKYMGDEKDAKNSYH